MDGTDKKVGCGRSSTDKNEIRVLDLFAGCGGMSLGFRKAGRFKIVGACQWEKKHPGIAETYRVNHPATQLVEADITLPATKDQICGLFSKRRCDVIIGGPPCNAYSSSGKGDPGDPRARLFEDHLEIIERLQPSVNIMENVQRIETAKNPSGGLVFDEIREGFRRLGYAVCSRVLMAADYGVPQRRKRVIIVAAKSGFRIRFPEPSHSEHAGLSCGRLPWVTMRDAIGDLEEAPEDRLWSHIFRRHTDSVVARYTSTPIGKKGCAESYHEGNYRNPPDQPSVTIKTVGWPLHYRYPRDLTCREAARIQSFPDDFRFLGGTTAVATMIGNAVPPLLARAVAGSVLEMLDKP